jgi:uncharacterized short protein YbdD (DUF466 family)
MSSARGWLRTAWRTLRALMGDDAYGRYLEHCRRRHPEAKPPARAEFYLSDQERRWSQVNRCC